MLLALSPRFLHARMHRVAARRHAGEHACTDAHNLCRGNEDACERTYGSAHEAVLICRPVRSTHVCRTIIYGSNTALHPQHPHGSPRTRSQRPKTHTQRRTPTLPDKGCCDVACLSVIRRWDEALGLAPASSLCQEAGVETGMCAVECLFLVSASLGDRTNARPAAGRGDEGVVDGPFDCLKGYIGSFAPRILGN